MNYTECYFNSETIYKNIMDLVTDIECISNNSPNHNDIMRFYNKAIDIDDIISKKTNIFFLRYINIIKNNSANKLTNSENIKLIVDLTIDVSLEVIKILKTMLQITIKAANGSTSNNIRKELSTEYCGLMNTMDKIIANLKFPCSSSISLFKYPTGKYKINKIDCCDDVNILLILQDSYTNINLRKTSILSEKCACITVDIIQKKLNEASFNLSTNNTARIQLNEYINTYKKNLRTKLNNFVNFLKKRADYYKCKGQICFTKSPKYEIPNWLSS